MTTTTQPTLNDSKAQSAKPATTFQECFDNLPKLASTYGFVAAYTVISAPNMEDVYVCLVKTSSINPWQVVELASWEVASFMSADHSSSALKDALAQHPTFDLAQFTEPTSWKGIDSQLASATGFGWSGEWDRLNDKSGHMIGFINKQRGKMCIYESTDLFRMRQNDITVDGGGFNLKGIREDYEHDQITPFLLGFASQELVDSRSYERAIDLADDVRTWHKEKHNRLLNLKDVHHYSIVCTETQIQAL